MIDYKLKLDLRNLLFRVYKPKVDLESLKAHFYKLPKKVEVGWFRDGKFIIGKIRLDDSEEITTQALSAKEFVEMVNDAILTAYEIPREYFDYKETYKPTKEQFERLNNAAIEKSEMEVEKKVLA